MTPLLFALFIVALVACVIRHGRSRPPNFPPGPFRFAVYGNYWQIMAANKFSHKGLRDMSVRLKSPVLGLYQGSAPVLVTNDLESTCEGLLKPEFQGRPDIFAVRMRGFGKLLGIFNIDGEFWAEQRRFSLRHMRDFGFGRRFQKLESSTAEEVQTLIDILRSPDLDKEVARVNDCGGCDALFPNVLYAGFLNPILEVLGGDGARVPRQEYGKVRALSRAVALFQKSTEPSGGIINVTPWVRHLFPGRSGYNGLLESNKGVIDFARDLIERNHSTFDADVPRGFLDKYYSEVLRRGDFNTSFADPDQLLLLAADYIFPTGSVISVTLAMAVIYMLRHPAMADRAHQEVVALVGRGRLPTLDDRPSLPYTEAFLREVLRIETSTTLSITHRVTEDTYFRGYFIPKGTLYIPNIWAANRDPAVFDRPDDFMPERFLDSTGRLARDPTVAFGFGKHLCAGETFARQTLFLFLAALVQNFSFSVPEGDSIPTDDEMLPGLIVRPEPFWVRVTERT